MEFSQFLEIGNRSKPQKPFPDRNLTETGGIESTFTQINNLEKEIRKVETITNQNQHINKNSFLDSPEIKDIIGIWYNHNFRANDEIKLKLKNEYNEVNKNNGNIFPSFDELFGKSRGIYNQLSKNEKKYSILILKELKKCYNSYLSINDIKNLQIELQNLKSKLKELEEINQKKVDENNSKLSAIQNNPTGSKSKMRSGQ